MAADWALQVAMIQVKAMQYTLDTSRVVRVMSFAVETQARMVATLGYFYGCFSVKRKEEAILGMLLL